MLLVLLANSIPALAAEIVPNGRNTVNADAIITITDPETGRVWEFEVPTTELIVPTASSYKAASTLYLSEDEVVNHASVTVDFSCRYYVYIYTYYLFDKLRFCE
ncbi:MAG: hypothetical protein K0R34_1943 [Herbinix sp.]|jgi:hypothetical protein|nr:hypothetical protein [Herbinix sp.]